MSIMGIFIQVLFGLIFLLIKRCAYICWADDKERFDYLKYWYYWFEYLYLFIATMVTSVITPSLNLDDVVVIMVIMVVIKVVFDQLLHLIDIFIRRFIKN